MSRGARARADVLVEAATSMPWPAADIDDLLVEWSRLAVGGEVTIEPTPAVAPDVSVVLPDRRYLVARRRPGEDPVEPQELRLLMALVTLSATSRHAARREARLRRQALTDDLTGLWHHGYFRELFDELADRRRPGETLAVLFLDIDRFKALNEQLGHLDADLVLAEVGSRVRGALPADSIVARTGGDELAAVVPGVRDPAHVERVVAAVRDAVGAPLPVADLMLGIEVSIGTAFSRSSVDEPDQLVREAEKAMRRTKRSRPDAAPPRWYDEHAVLRDMLDQGLVQVAYQPVVDLGDHTVRGYEALVRGRHDDLGSVPPVMLVGAAIRLRLLDELTEVVVDQAVTTMRAVCAATGAPTTLSVNIEFEQLRPESALLHSLPDRVAGSGVQLVLEISERQVGRWTPAQVVVATDLAAAGIGLAVDDFGAGWSTLALLNSWPWTWVKIDRSLVSREAGEPGRKLLGHVARMLADLDLTAVAEGIETPGELADTRAAGVHLAQGLLLGGPVTSDVVLAHVAQHGRAAPPASA